MSQTTIEDGQTKATFPGALGGIGPYSAETYTSSEASAEIPFGRMVMDDGVADGEDDSQLPGDKLMKLLSGAGGVLAGVLMHGYKSKTDVGDSGIKPMASGTVMRKGLIWVHTETAVAPGDQVHVRHTVDTGKFLGDFLSTNGGDAGKSLNISKFARWRCTTSGAGDALLEFDLTMAANASADT